MISFIPTIEKMSKKTSIFLLVLMLVPQLSAFSQRASTDLTPKYSNEFLNIGVGARALGMSAAQVASVNDVTSGYWNPAGLSKLGPQIQVAAMHSEYFAGIAKFDYASVGKAIDSSSAAAFSIIRFGVDDIPNTTNLIDEGGNIDYDRITKFSAVDYAFIFSYGRKGLTGSGNSFINDSQFMNRLNNRDRFSWGVNAKIIYRYIGDFAQGWGFGIDAGMQYAIGKWQIGVVAKDITTTFNAWSYSLSTKEKEVFQNTGNEIPKNALELTMPRVIAGIGRSFSIKKTTLLAEANAVMTTDGKRNVLVSSKPVSIDPSMGLEAAYNKTIFVRAGIGNFQRVKEFDNVQSMTFQPNIGLGLRIRTLQIDYALSDIGNVSDVLYSNVFSLRIFINAAKRNSTSSFM
jgi:hypothetical protein